MHGENLKLILIKFGQKLGNINSTFKTNSFQKFSRIEIYKTLAVSIFLYGSEIWTLRQKGKNRLTSIEKNIFPEEQRYALFDHKTNEEIMEEMKVETVDGKIKQYK